MDLKRLTRSLMFGVEMREEELTSSLYHCLDDEGESPELRAFDGGS